MALQKGYSEIKIQEHLAYALVLYNRNLPIIYDLKHFSLLVGYSVEYFERLSERTANFYREFNITKKKR
jgi:RNA-directed DNA polymerase